MFCVGDDWQSIYRFAGSDIGYILNLEKYWGATEISKIETTYRFSQTLIEISGRFVMSNPAQIKKVIQGKRDEVGFPLGEISGYNEKCAVAFMVEKLNDLPKGSSVFFVGRYSFDEKLLSDSGMLDFWEKIVPKLIDITKEVGCKYIYLFAADKSEETGNTNIKSLVNYYKNDFKFYESEDDDLIIVKPDYDEDCYGLIQEVGMLENNREAVWHEFSDV